MPIFAVSQKTLLMMGRFVYDKEGEFADNLMVIRRQKDIWILR